MQFIDLTGNDSFFQQESQLLDSQGTDDIQVTKSQIVTGEKHSFLAPEQLRKVSTELGAVLLEPVGRNTAPKLTLAALLAQKSTTNPVLVVIPANQTVAKPTVFTLAMQ